MNLRPGLKVIGNGVGGTYLQARRIKTLQSGTALRGQRWFRCRHCQHYFVGGPSQTQPASVEAAECFAHEALCARRPAELPVSDRERGALETVHGTQLRELIALLDGIIESGPEPTEHARTVERRAVLVAELIRIGLQTQLS